MVRQARLSLASMNLDKGFLDPLELKPKIKRAGERHQGCGDHRLHL